MSAGTIGHGAWLAEGLLSRGDLTMLLGSPGVGKSLWAIDVGMRLAQGRPMPYRDAPDARRGLSVLHCPFMGSPEYEIGPRIHAAERAGYPSTRYRVLLDHPDPRTADDMRGLIASLGRERELIGGLDLVVVDPLPALPGGPKAATRPLAAFAAESECAVLALHYPPKWRRPAAIPAGVRHALLLSRRHWADESPVLTRVESADGADHPRMGWEIAAETATTPGGAETRRITAWREAA